MLNDRSRTKCGSYTRQAAHNPARRTGWPQRSHTGPQICSTCSRQRSHQRTPRIPHPPHSGGKRPSRAAHIQP